jgi:hypoxanthine phosphoribosyltransferase
LTAEREFMTWDDLGSGSRALAEQVHEDGYAPDFILAIARGGLLVAGGVSYALGVKNTFTMNVEYYTGIDERLPAALILPPVPELVDLSKAKVLITDDVADTGLTIRLVKDFCRGKVGEIRTAILYLKPQAVVECEYVWRHTDRWIVFPWSARPPVGEESSVSAAAV